MNRAPFKCLRCDHTWFPRKSGKPRVCPCCHSAWWETLGASTGVSVFNKSRLKQKKLVRNICASAIASGLLVREPCEECGVVPADAHHDDYSKPLEVRWLCKLHHEALHSKTRHLLTIPCGWCGEILTTTLLRTHVAICPKRPNLGGKPNEPVVPKVETEPVASTSWRDLK